MLITYHGSMIKVHLLPGCLTVEFEPEVKLMGDISMVPQGIYVIEYDEIKRVLHSGKEVILVLEDGSNLRLNVEASEDLYNKLVKILTSIGKY